MCGSSAALAYRSGKVSGLLHGLRGLGQERPEDLEVVRVDRVQLEPYVDAVAAGVLGEAVGILDDDVARTALDEHRRQPGEVGAERVEDGVVGRMPAQVRLGEAAELLDAQARLPVRHLACRVSKLSRNPGQSMRVPPGSGRPAA